MKKFIRQKIFILLETQGQKGYALLFTVILVSIISLIGLGLSNTIYKQVMLSSEAKDSQLAFYQSDMAMDCALYVDNQTNDLTSGKANFTCGIDKNGQPYTLNIGTVITQNQTIYSLNPSSLISDSTNPCFRINITKDNSTNKTATTIMANGYNICNVNNSRTVERTIEVQY